MPTTGIELVAGAVGTVVHNTVSGNVCPAGIPEVCGDDFFTQIQEAGIGAGGSGPGTVISHNVLTGNQIGLFLSECDEIAHNVMVDNEYFGLAQVGVLGGAFTIEGGEIVRGGGGLWVTAVLVDMTVVLKKVSFSGLSGPAVEILVALRVEDSLAFREESPYPTPTKDSPPSTRGVIAVNGTLKAVPELDVRSWVAGQPLNPPSGRPSARSSEVRASQRRLCMPREERWSGPEDSLHAVRHATVTRSNPEHHDERIMKYTGKEIVQRIRAHVKRRGGPSSSWFIGVSAKPRQALFETHAVRKEGDYWILAHARSSAVARKVKLFLASKIGMVQVSEPMEKADFVYAYRKAH